MSLFLATKYYLILRIVHGIGSPNMDVHTVQYVFFTLTDRASTIHCNIIGGFPIRYVVC